MIPDLNASSAAVLSWLLTYAIHSTILLGAAVAIAMWFADEHAWLDLVWKTALLGPLVTASVQVGAEVLPLGGRWHIATASHASSAPAMRPAPRVETPSEPEKTVDAPSSTSIDRGSLSARSASPAITNAGPSQPVVPAWPVISVLAWLSLAAIGVVRFAARVLRLHRVLGSGPPVCASHLRHTLEALGGTTGKRRRIRLTTSRTCVVPLALAGRQIVLPERFLRELDGEQQSAALAHEIAHVVRRDPAWRIIAAMLVRAFFFQPLNRVARAKLCDSAEFLCDQWAVQQTRSPIALARCLATVATWASPAGDKLAASASTMTRSDSPLVRRVTRILNEPSRPSRRPSAAWLVLPLPVVAMAAPLVTAAQLPNPADAALASATLGQAIASTDARKEKQEPTALRSWTVTEINQARARLRVHTPSRPTDPLEERWRWALGDAARQGIRDFWIVYSFDTPTHARDLMVSDTREGTFVGTTLEVASQGPPLGDVLRGPAASAVGNVTVLVHYDGTRPDAIDRAGYRSTRLGFEFGRTPIFWLGTAPERESFGRVTELFGLARPEKIRLLLIELASLHPDTDLVLPFLTRLVDPPNPVAIRQEAAEGFDHHHDPRSVEVLLRVARTDPAAEVRVEAAETIGEVQTPQSIPALTDLATNSPDSAVRREAAEAFSDQPPGLALPAIDRLVATTAHEEVLIEAIEALGEISDTRVMDLLVRTAAGHPNRRAQQEAVETLGDLEDSGAVAALVRIVWEHKEATIQREAVETLGDRRDAAAVAELERILREHPVEDVQVEAIETLADTPGQPLNEHIRTLALSGRSPRLRREALHVIGHTASKTTDAQMLDKAQQTIESAIFNDPDRDVRQEAFDALDELPRDRALRVLRNVLERHPDQDFREEARKQRGRRR